MAARAIGVTAMVAGIAVGSTAGVASATSPTAARSLTGAEQQAIAKQLAATELVQIQVDEGLARPVDQKVLVPLEQLQHLLASGDLEAAVAQLQQARVAALDEQ